jgi:hypothetical protein
MPADLLRALFGNVTVPASVRETSSLEQAVFQAQDAGRKYIYVASRVLGAKPDRTGLRQAVHKGGWELRFTH